MKDTPTIDELLKDLQWQAFNDEGLSDSTIETAKQALLQWHKDKARSYVPEKRNGAVDPQTGAPVGMQGCVDHGFDQAIDQTLKSIEEDKI